MVNTVTRRPLPALVSLLALLLLTALVWWRVLHRADGADQTTSCPSTPADTVQLPAPDSVTVQVLNATKRNGIASKVRTTLVSDGFKVPDQAINDRKHVNKIPGVAEIRYGPKGKAAATLVRYYFPGAKMVPSTSKTADVVISLGKKYRRVATESAVERALSADKVSLSTPAPSPTASGTASC